MSVMAISNRTSADRTAGDRSHLGRGMLLALVLLLLASMLISMATGASGASARAIVGSWFGAAPESAADALRDHAVIYNIRLPRMLLGMLVGAALAVSGLLMQGLFRNPLADPGLVGVSAGAGLGAVGIIVLGTTALAPLSAVLGIYALQLAAFLGGLLTTFILYRVATRSGQTAIATMLLAGIAQVLGIDLPTLDSGSAGHLIMEALAVIFLRQGLKSDIGRA